MRFLFYDRVTKLEKNKQIVGTTTFSLSAEYHRGHFARIALIPGSLYIEAMAQLLGWLIVYSHDFQLSAIMSMIEDVQVPSQSRPGFEAHVFGELQSTCATDSVGRAWVENQEGRIASMDRILYSHFPQENSGELESRFHYFSGLTNFCSGMDEVC